MWVGGDGDIHVLRRAGAVVGGKRGGNVVVQICAVAGEGVGGFHTQLIQSNNCVTMNL